MQKQFAKYIIVIIVLVFGYTGLVASATQISNLSLRLLNDRGRVATLTGEVLATESEMPLAHGTVSIQGQQVPIENGHFTISDLGVGEQRIQIDGPFRTSYDSMIRIYAEDNQVTISVDSYVPQDEIDMLARITRAEAEGESATGRTAVAASVLNRVLSLRYPSSVREVVYQRISGRYQYSPVADGRIRLAPRVSDYEAAYSALAGNDPSLGATGFFNPAKTRDRWVRSNPVTTVIGGHRFFSY